ncbi:sulfotransferase family protein [Actinomadura barringtoniae]|uniref:Sulfotransferase family protein n=1 Tax=Actinomadura barringtoniae TaxID=1427535 RepID=A0A939TET4_9ACTN|nr:sulfotransferase family protein [Actinomadura barringtoniae]MBO2453685.1 sulfotransferase family protein [Actinomadura barringtoniae]
MKVIGVGIGRTGTLSLKAAVERLGFGPCFHGRHVLDHRERLPLWMAAASGEKVDLRGLFAGYESTMDWPGASFWRELVEAYPDAKVILTERDPDSWYDSVARTIYPMFGSRSDPRAEEARQVVPGLDIMTEFTRRLIWDGAFFGGRFEDRDHAIAVFMAHNEAVRREVPAERLLICEAAVGWDVLCDFLDVPVPDEPYPHLNDPDRFWGRVQARMAESQGAS